LAGLLAGAGWLSLIIRLLLFIPYLLLLVNICSCSVIRSIAKVNSIKTSGIDLFKTLSIAALTVFTSLKTGITTLRQNNFILYLPHKKVTNI
jgi:hypothetical protein